MSVRALIAAYIVAGTMLSCRIVWICIHNASAECAAHGSRP